VRTELLKAQPGRAAFYAFGEAILKAFVTGATGFVGSHVAHLLAAKGADLRLLVRPEAGGKISQD
jgi:hypothetical protein